MSTAHPSRKNRRPMMPKPATKVKRRLGYVRRFWTAADDARLRAEYPHLSTLVLAALMDRTVVSVYARARGLGLAKTAAYLASPEACRLRRGGDFHPGRATQFKPGQVPANKGLRRPGWAPGRMRETQFKAGVPTWRTMPIGSTRLIEGYVYRKVSDLPRVPYTVNWKPEHHLRWTKARGPIPVGYVLAFRNHDRADLRLANLELLPRRALMARNTVHTLPKPLARAVHLLGALTRQIHRREAAL